MGENETIEKLAMWLCIQKNYNWDYLSAFSKQQLRFDVIKMLHDIPEIKIEDNEK